ncbi:MAG: class I SAM-dependent methyltransferase [Frankiaceae bacterium]|nr:class I SAM-dependent methyltransferase [Frankiaceae bacterium]
MSEDVVEQTRATYDRVAVDYDASNPSPAPEFATFRTAFAKQAGGIVADLGCGPGRDLAALRDAGVRALGVDLSPGMLAVARGRGVDVVQGDLRRPPIRDGSLGAIWSSAALLHVPRADVANTLAAWHALLRPGGLLGLSTSLGGGEGWELVPYAGEGPRGGELHRWFVHHERDELLAHVAAAGFSVTSCEERTSHRQWAMIRATA